MSKKNFPQVKWNRKQEEKRAKDRENAHYFERLTRHPGRLITPYRDLEIL